MPHLTPEALVTLTRTDVIYAATEFGCVCLKGKSARERARALISIADPDSRPEPIQYAEDVKYFILPEHGVFWCEAMLARSRLLIGRLYMNVLKKVREGGLRQ